MQTRREAGLAKAARLAVWPNAVVFRTLQVQLPREPVNVPEVISSLTRLSLFSEMPQLISKQAKSPNQ